MVDLRLVALITLMAPAPAQARPGDLDRSFAGDGRTAYGMDGGGAVYGFAVTDGRRALVSVGSPYGTQPATLALTAGGRLARRTMFGPPAISPPWFANGHALTKTGPEQYTLTRIGEAGGVTLAGAGEGFGVDGAGRALLTFGSSRGHGRRRTTTARYRPGGALDRSYGRNGVALIANVGRARCSSGATGGSISSPNATGAAGACWSSTPAGGDYATSRRARGRFERLDGPTNLLAAPGGRLLVTGADALQRGWVLRLGADGRPEVKFGRVRGDRLAGSEARFISLDDRGRILIAGEAYDENYMSRDDSGLSYPAVARLLG